MLIEQVNALDPKPLERALNGLLDVLGLTILAERSRPMILTAQIETELGGDHHFVTVGSESFAH